MLNLPLYTLFETIRDRFNRHLGLADYLLLLEATQKGIGIADKNELRDICAMLWLKNKPQQDGFKALFETYSQKRVEDFFKEINKNTYSVQDEDHIEKIKPDPDLKDNSTTQKIHSDDSQNISKRNEVDDSDAIDTNSNEMVTVQWNVGKITSNIGTEITEGDSSERWKLSGKYIMSNDYLPFNERQLTQQWRRLRRRQVAGESQDMNIQATIKNIVQQGFFDKPVMKRHFINDYRLIILVDRKGSMLAFHTLSDLIVETLQQELPKIEVWYFRNQPQDYFYGRPDWTQAIKTKDWLFQLAQKPANIFIISDGGAARGKFVTERLQAWWRFFKEVKPIVPNIVWLNPMPKERWGGSTAGYLEKFVNMIEYGENLDHIKRIIKIIKS